MRIRLPMSLGLALTMAGALLTPGVAGAAPPTAAVAPRAAAEPAALRPGAGQFVPVDATTPVANIAMTAGSVHTATLAGTNGLPAAEAISAVAMHVISYQPTGTGWIQVYPDGPRPAGDAALNYATGKDASSFEVVPLSVAGKVSFYATAPTKLYARLVGYYTSANVTTPGSTYVPLAPVRLANAVSIAAGGTTTLTVAGANGVGAAADVGAVSLVLVAGSPSAGGALQAYPAGITPVTAHAGMYWPAGQTRSQAHIVRTSADGKITVKSSAAIKLTAYLRGYYQRPTGTAAGSTYHPVATATAANGVSLAANGTTTLTLAGAYGMPAADQISAVATNLTAASPTGTGYLQTWPGDTAPVDGSVYYASGVGQSDYDTSLLSAAGQVTVKATAAVRLYVRTRGYFQKALAPAEPTDVDAEPGDGQVSVTWTAPASDGGAAITSYRVTATPGGRTAVVNGGTSAVVTGLTNGDEYTFAVTATNAAGESVPSIPSIPIAPAAAEASPEPGPPGAPEITDVLPRDSEVRVSWDAPTGGDKDITKYVVTAEPGGYTVESEATTAIVPWLTNGTEYIFTVVAVNDRGTGPESAPSEPVEPEPGEEPHAPVITAAIPLDGRIDVQWVAPPDGGSPITDYTVTAQPGNHRLEVFQDTTVVTIGGLENGTAYTVNVTATNKIGTGEPGTVAALTPAARRAPAVPSDVRASVRATGTMELTWDAPVDIGTARITSYTITATPGGATTTSTSTSASISGLDPATAYSFAVAATNQYGTGPVSVPTAAINPRLAIRRTPAVLSDAAAKTLRELRPDAMIFDSPPAEVTNLTPGTLVVMRSTETAPKGTFRRVLGVARQGDEVVLNTEEAPLSEAIEAGSLAMSETVDAGDVAGFTPRSSGVRLEEPTIKGRTLREGANRKNALVPKVGLRDGTTLVIVVEEKFGADNGPFGKINGTIELQPKLDGSSLRIGSNGVEADFKPHVVQKASVKVTTGVGLKWSKSIPVANIQITCWFFALGEVPVLICVNLEVKMKLTAEGSVGVEVATSYTKESGADIKLRGSEVSSKAFDKPAEFKPPMAHFYGDASATVSFPFELGVYLYDFIGPGLVVTPYVKIAADTYDDPWWKLVAGWKSGVFFKSESIFGVKLDYRVDDLSFVERTFATAKDPSTFIGITVDPQRSTTTVGVPKTLGIRVSHYTGDIDVKWKVIKGPGTIDQNGRYVSDRNGTAEISAISPANDIHPKLEAKASIVVGDGQPHGSNRIMVVGDSISQGLEGDYTWRYRLWQHLSNSKTPATFVGPWKGTTKPPASLPDGWPENGTPPVRDGAYRPGISFPSDHSAQWGWQMEQAKNGIQDTVRVKQPDYVLLELGFNDLAWGVGSPDNVIADLKTFVDEARRGKLNVKFLVANVVHRTPLSGFPNLPGTITAYNNKLGAAVDSLNEAWSPVALVNIDSPYNPASDTYDGLHPNGVGEYKIAREFANVLHNRFGVGPAFGSVPSWVPGLYPATPAWTKATATDAGITVSWQHSFGAGGYWFYARDVTAGQSFQKLPLPIPADSWKAGWLINGHTYEYKVVAMRGDRFLSGGSPTARAKANTKTAAGPAVESMTVYAAQNGADLTWKAPVGPYSDTVRGYNVYYLDQATPGEFPKIRYTAGTSIKLTGLTNGHRYGIAVSSVNAAGEGLPTGAPAVLPGGGIPSSPRLLSAKTTGGCCAALLKWTASTDAAAYWIWARDNSVSDPQFGRLPLQITGTENEVGWLFPNSLQYDFMVQAANGTQNSMGSNVMRVSAAKTALARSRGGVGDLLKRAQAAEVSRLTAMFAQRSPAPAPAPR